MDKISVNITRRLIKENFIEESNYQVYRYGIQMFLEITASFAASMIIGGLFGMIMESLIFFAVFIPLRSYLGGVHMSSYGACFIECVKKRTC